MIDFLIEQGDAWLPTSLYYVHAVCLAMDPILIWGLGIGHLSIFVCYWMISADFVKPAVSGRFPMPGLFCWFIRLCGWSHLAALLTIFTPWYWAALGIILATAAVSAPAAYFFRQLRKHWEALDHASGNAGSGTV